MADIPISVFSNEDLSRDFFLRVRKPEFASVRRPTADQLDPAPIDGATWECFAVFGSRMIPLTVTVIDAPNSGVNVSAASDPTLKPLKGKSGTWYLLMVRSGKRKRLFGGPFEVKSEATT